MIIEQTYNVGDRVLYNSDYNRKTETVILEMTHNLKYLCVRVGWFGRLWIEVTNVTLISRRNK